MTSSRQIEANRRNAQLSTGPATAEGKQRSRRNAIRHGLTAETVIDALEDAEDYAAFEMSVTADFEVTSAVERELVLRLASILWRLRRATAIESGLFRIQALHPAQPEQPKEVYRQHQNAINGVHALAQPSVDSAEVEPNGSCRTSTHPVNFNDFDDLTRSYTRMASLPICPLDRISRYETRLWRQACQILLSLKLLSRPKPWSRPRLP